MPPKKRDKDDGTKNNIVNRDIQVEHELFLQAFEKPTQIYRYLRTRNMISPVFLHRTLTYMKHRMSRNHKRRNDFKIDNMLAEKLNKSRYDRNHCLGDYMSLMFLGFYDKTLCNNDYTTENDLIYNDIVRVETILLKISHKKRKDSSSSYIQESFGTIDIPVNPLDIDENDKIPAISIPTDAFTVINGTPYNQSYILLLKVETIPKLTNNLLSADGEEPGTKRQKSNTKIYGSELIIFDKHNRCLLAEGEYELALSEVLTTTATMTATTATAMTTTSTAAATMKNSSPKKHTTWEIIPDDINFEMNDKYDNRFELFNKCPTLKFYLKWTNEPYTGYAKRPKPIIALPTTTSEAVAANAAAATAAASTTIATNGTGRSTAVMTMSTTATSTTTLTSTTAVSHHQTNGIEKSNNLVNGNVHVNMNNNNYNCTSNKNGSKTSSSTTNLNLVDYNSSMINERVQTIYQFIYNNNSRQQTEPCDDMHCPWCSLDCMALYSLLKHLKLCHARFTFTYVPIGSNAARIDVAINDMYDGSYTGSPHDLVGPASGCAFARNGPVRRTTVTNLLVCRPRRQKPNLSEFLELDENELNNQRPYITGHNRLYHHTETCLPVHPKELDIDSEGESDPLWLQYKTMQMIDEFTDVNEGEKELMKMWNLHIMKYGYVGDCQLSIACDMFLDVRGKELLKKNLYRNFVLHMCSLFDYGLVSPEIVYKTIQKLQNILSTYPEGRKVIAESREAQLDYWLNFGIQKQAQQEELKQKQQQQQSQQTKQSDTKSSTTSANTESNNKKNMEKDRLSRESVGDKEKDIVTPATTAAGKISNGGNSNNGESQQPKQRQQNTNMTALQRKRSLNSLQNEIIGGKRRLSQLRDSPPRRRSVPSSDQQSQQQQQQQQNQQQPKTILARRKSVALFHTTTSTTATTVTDNKNISNNSLSSSVTLASSSSSIPNNQQQTTVRKRVASIAKVDKH